MAVAAPLVLAALTVSSLLPRTPLPTVDCGARIESSVTLDRDLACGSQGFVVAGDDITIDCAGHSIRTDAIPGLTTLRIASGTNIVIRDCRLIGGWFGIRATFVSGLEVSRSSFEDVFQTAISAVDSADVGVVDNTFRGERNFVAIHRSPRVRVERNSFHAHGRHSYVHIGSGPDSIIARNDFDGGGFASIEGDRAEISQNAFSGKVSSISVLRTSSCRVRGNRFHAADGTLGGSILLSDGRDCDIEGNLIERAYTCGFLVGGVDPARGGNRVAKNDVRGGSFGLCLFDLQRDSILDNDFAGNAIGILALGYEGQRPDEPPTRISGNRIERAVMGILPAYGGGLIISDNIVSSNDIGIYEIAIPPDIPPANLYENNRVESNGGFGMIVAGTSPVLRGNVFDGNGGATELSQDTQFFGWFLGDARGGIALVPAAGYGNDTIDDGVPENDAVTSPSIGSAEAPNFFRNNIGQDIFALDSRPANAATLIQDNRFLGQVPWFHQTWRALVRVVDLDGLPVDGAAVQVVDFSGDVVLEATTDSEGLAPDGSDPLRSQGRSEAEPNGPAPGWPIVTQAMVDDRGRWHPATPHRVIATRGSESGCVEYSWNGIGEAGEAGTSIAGRYQTAIVRLGSQCAGVSPSNTSARYGEGHGYALGRSFPSGPGPSDPSTPAVTPVTK